MQFVILYPGIKSFNLLVTSEVDLLFSIPFYFACFFFFFFGFVLFIFFLLQILSVMCCYLKTNLFVYLAGSGEGRLCYSSGQCNPTPHADGFRCQINRNAGTAYANQSCIRKH